MKKTLLLVLTLSGLSALPANVFKEYHVVQLSKSWTDAQSYCREKFTDLATVENQDENDRLLKVWVEDIVSWIGLCDDITALKWSLGNADLNNEFSNWAAGRLPKRNTNEICIAMTPDGSWVDQTCTTRIPSVCYYERGPANYIFVSDPMTWYQAQTYCRDRYTDLAIVRNTSENNEISSLLSSTTWIGLHRKPWAYWSDKTPLTFTNWRPSQPDDNLNEKVCAAVSGREWWDDRCDKRFYFICQTVHYPQHKRFKLKFQSKADLNDPDVQQQILQQLHAKLEKHGLSDFKLRWTQTDGQTFHQEQERKKEKGPCD